MIGPCIEVETATAGKVRINVAADYIHLGLHIDKGATFRPEVLRRLSQARAAFQEVQGVLLVNRHIPRPTRAQLFDALVDATFFNLELWNEDQEAAWKKMVVGHAKLQRAILRKELPAECIFRLSPADITLILGSPSLKTMLRTKRLRYLTSLVKAGPEELWAVLKLEAGWLKKVEADLNWFRQYAEGSWPDVSHGHWPLWWHELKERTGRFKRQVGKVSRRATLAELKSDFAAETDLALDRISVECGRIAASREAAKDDTAIYCVPCGQPFVSKSNLMCHLRHVHDRHADHLHYDGGLLCCGCGMHQHSMSRMLVHLKSVPRCWQAVRRAGLIRDQPHPGEGSRVRNKDKAANPKIVPSLPKARFAIVYDDGCPDVLLPREKLVRACASMVGGAVEDWVGETTWPCTDSSLTDYEVGLWRVVKRAACRFPLLLAEFQEALRIAKADIVDLQAQTLFWDGQCLEFTTRQLETWAATLTYQALLDNSSMHTEGWHGRVTSDGCARLRHIDVDAIPDGAIFLTFGDLLCVKERTCILPVIERLGATFFECGWDLDKLREIDLSRVVAISLNVCQAWEAKDACRINQGWSSFALETWSSDVALHHAGVCRAFFVALRTAWRLLLHGRLASVIVGPEAVELLRTAPVCRLSSHGGWFSWKDSGCTALATARGPGGGSLSRAWGFTVQGN